MYLKALEIQGFKSFPDKTVLNFGADITAIVGPNGSGKSNISDAIRWVMGEQNSRQLRGTKMEDVIFGGTEKRGPMGFAQVTLVIDNTEHVFKRDEIEVAVTRRYYRSGESEYYINRQSCRLRDINELFMDTGMGREGYSIIGQGKIDEILSVKSGERREVFEEAAGISKFRHRKEDAEKKLEKTEENLVRINDKISELELQVEPLRQQAETAKKYLVLHDELRVLEISVWLENLQELKTSAIKLQADFETAVSDKEKAKAELEAIYQTSSECGERIRENDIAADSVRSEMSGLESEIRSAEAEIAVLRNTVDHNNDSIERLNREMSDTLNRTGSLQSQIEGLESRIAEIDTESADIDEKVNALVEKIRGIAQSAGNAAEETEALRAKEALETASAADCRAELSALTAGIREVEERRVQTESDLAAAKEKLASSETESRANRRALNEAREEEQAVNNIIQGHSIKMDSRKTKAEESKNQKIQLTMDVGALENRIRLLTEMEKEYEGFSKSVKTVMQAREHSVLRGIHGPVASLMKTNEQYTVALEIAMGAGLQNIVVEREEDAKAAMNFLKNKDAGRATFLPMTAIRGDELREKGLEDEYGFIGIASQLVDYDRKYDNIFRYLLGRTVVVEDLDCGIALSRKYQNRFRIVTLDGQLLNRGGSMTGGSVSRSTGVLSRANELEHLQGSLKGMQEKLRAATEKAEQSERELQKAQYELEVAQSQQHKAESDVLTLEGKQNHYDILLENLEASIETMENDLESMQQRKERDQKRITEVESEISGHEKAAQELHTRLEASRSGESSLMETTSQLSDEISAHKAKQAALLAEKDSSLHNIEDLKRLQADLNSDCSSREEVKAKYQEENRQAENQIAEKNAAAEELRSRSTRFVEKLQKLSDEKMELEASRNSVDKEMRDRNETVLNTEREVSRLEQKLNANAMEEKNILDKLWERYELSHSDAMEQRVELESVPKATRRIAELTRSIKALGTPNIGAIEEYDRVNTRYTYLSEQRTDVEKAKDEMVGIIEEITKQMTEIFAEQFQLLNESFQQTFVELFGGGKAKLELEDENDILNCGIEIKAQPPGKQLKTITLLSGGEKAFVAIALYFAIIKVHPTPFCIMDEIEAALDEANVIRYARYMRSISEKTQFIVITHRRGTMEEADVLYGVTMQERGISRILTVNLNDVVKELKIK